jgi:SAM-dependent methyltransferase
VAAPESPVPPERPNPHSADGAARVLPSGLRWRLTSRLTAQSRGARFTRFMELMAPTPTDRILDVGVTDTDWRSSNPLEAAYAWPERITAVGLEPMPTFQKLFPTIRFVVADGRDLPFADGTFDIGYSNAVIEHVGNAAQQRRFVCELLRTCRRVFISTPNAHFPIDPHTLLPFVHWLPRSVRHPILRATGNGQWATESALRPLSAAGLRSMFPTDSDVRIVQQRVLGIAIVLTAIADTRSTDHGTEPSPDVA